MQPDASRWKERANRSCPGMHQALPWLQSEHSSAPRTSASPGGSVAASHCGSFAIKLAEILLAVTTERCQASRLSQVSYMIDRVHLGKISLWNNEGRQIWRRLLEPQACKLFKGFLICMGASPRESLRSPCKDLKKFEFGSSSTNQGLQNVG